MGVDTAEPPQPVRRQPVFLQIGDQDAVHFAGQYLNNFSAAVDQQADLPPGFGRKGAQVPAQFVGDDGLGRDPPSAQIFQPLDLAGLEP
jgi:hypothetical protein